MKNYITKLTLDKPQSKQKIDKICGIKIVDVLTGQVIQEISSEEILMRDDRWSYEPGWLARTRGEW
jgi:hypothetical protein